MRSIPLNKLPLVKRRQPIVFQSHVHVIWKEFNMAFKEWSFFNKSQHCRHSLSNHFSTMSVNSLSPACPRISAEQCIKMVYWQHSDSETLDFRKKKYQALFKSPWNLLSWIKLNTLTVTEGAERRIIKFFFLAIGQSNSPFFVHSFK